MYAPSPAIAPAPTESPYVRVSGGLFLVFFVGAVLGLTTANPLLTAASILSLPLYIALLWRKGETPVLLFAVSFQWLQVSAKVFHADFLGVRVSEVSWWLGGDSLEVAIWLGLVGLAVLSFGMRLGMRKLQTVSHEGAEGEVRMFSLDRAFLLYLIGAAVTAVVSQYAWVFKSVTQILIAVVSVKWAFFFLLGYLVVQRNQRYLYFLTAIAIEFIGGIGFFSGFKVVLFVTLLVIFTVRFQLRPSTVVMGAVLLAALMLFSATWTSIKNEYRSFLNQGSGSQETVVSRSEQINGLVELVTGLEWTDVKEAIEPMFIRLAYVDYFALTMDYVPEYRPHEGGEVWKNSILHVLQPRFLFPNKPVLRSDSEFTMRYTGLYLAGDEDGTSISIGYMGESYIDFGRYGMFAPIFLLGICWGAMYAFVLRKARNPVFGYAFATALLVEAYQFEIASIKLFGGVAMKFMVLAVILHLLEPRLRRWLQGGGAPARLSRPAYAH